MSGSLLGAPSLSLAESVAEAFANLYAQRQRSALALLGILIGTASIVAMLTIGHMAGLETLKLFRHLGADMLQIHAMPAGASPDGVLDRGLIERLPATDSAVVAAAPLVADHDTVSAGGATAELGVAAVTAELPRLVRLSVSRGRFIAPIDDDNLVAVIGEQAAQKLSAPGAPVIPGAKVGLKGYEFTVIGVLGPVPYTALDPMDINNTVLIPLAGARRIFNPPDPTTALVHLRADANVKAAGQRISAALANPTATLEVISARDLIRGMTAQKALHSRLLIAVGAISLLVGGIGVMNVMLMGVMERRREIGLRAAMGATPRDLQLMFLVEAASLAFVGGLVGLACGLAAALVTAKASGWSFSVALWVLPLGPGVAALVGVAFGLYPAVKASRLSPIEALRAE
ncbi:MAG: ABC transporter permease [Caulobacteraceae bacterium]